MNEPIKVNINENQEPVISGRELHEKLEIGTQYSKWFERMADYGFSENIDFTPISQKRLTAQGNYTEYTDHILKLDMAKEISMIQRNEKGKQMRKYFIEIEKEFNTPEKIMACALRIADKEISNLQLENKIQQQQIQELQPKASYYDVILNTPDLISVTQIAKDYGMSARTLNQVLHTVGIQFNQGGVWLLYQKYAMYGYTSSKTSDYQRPDGTIGSTIHTYWTQKGRMFLYDMLKNQNILPLIERGD